MPFSLFLAHSKLKFKSIHFTNFNPSVRRGSSGRCLLPKFAQRLEFILFSVSPIKSFDGLYCVMPKSGACNVTDNTALIWKQGINNCDLQEAQFIFDKSSGSITHKCSGKPVCPKDGSNGYSTPIVISSKCPAMQLKRNFMRTHGEFQLLWVLLLWAI